MSAPELERTPAWDGHARTAALYSTWAREAAEGLASLSPAMASAGTSVSPQLARAAQATENAWRDIDTEFGLLSSTEVAEFLGYGRNRSWASAQRKDGKMLGVRRGGGYRYPGFQLPPAARAVVPRLASIGHAAGWSDESIVLWLCSPSGHMPGDGRPVDHLASDPERVVTASEQVMNQQW